MAIRVLPFSSLSAGVLLDVDRRSINKPGSADQASTPTLTGTSDMSEGKRLLRLKGLRSQTDHLESYLKVEQLIPISF